VRRTTTERELTQFFNHDAGAFGFRSNQAAVFHRLCGIQTVIIQPDEAMTDALLLETKRHKKVRAKLQSLDVAFIRVLEATYDQTYRHGGVDDSRHHYGSPFSLTPLTVVFGRHLGAVLCTCTLPLQDLLTLANKKLRRGLANKQPMTIQEEQQLFLIRDAGVKAYDAAHSAYEQALQ
jgi:hypothetical protein